MTERAQRTQRINTFRVSFVIFVPFVVEPRFCAQPKVSAFTLGVVYVRCGADCQALFFVDNDSLTHDCDMRLVVACGIDV